jgi:hypothetical protein
MKSLAAGLLPAREYTQFPAKSEELGWRIGLLLQLHGGQQIFIIIDRYAVNFPDNCEIKGLI